MADENNNEQESTTPGQEPRTYTQEDIDRKLGNLVQQVTDLKSTNDELQKASEERTAADEQARTEELKSQEKYKDLLQELEQKSTENATAWEQKESAYKAQIAGVMQDNVLANAGIADPVTVAGLKSMYASTEDGTDFAEFVKSQGVEPAAAPPSGKPSGNVGTVPQASGGDLQSRMNSSDPAVKRKALEEYGRSQFG